MYIDLKKDLVKGNNKPFIAIKTTAKYQNLSQTYMALRKLHMQLGITT